MRVFGEDSNNERAAGDREGRQSRQTFVERMQSPSSRTMMKADTLGSVCFAISLCKLKVYKRREKMNQKKSIYDKESFYEAYSQMARSQEGLKAAGEWHQMRRLFPDLKNAAVLDLGCGYGWHSKYAADCGAASVLGIDVSEKMIAAAMEKNADDRVFYKVMDLTQYDYPANTYDFVISNLVLHYIEDLNVIYEKIYDTLKPGGVFLMNIEHPVFTAGIHQEWVYDADGNPIYWPVNDYFYPGKRVTKFLGHEVLKEHHTLTQIFTGLLETGFCIDAVLEVQPPEEMMDLPGMKDEMGRPMMLLIRVSK